MRRAPPYIADRGNKYRAKRTVCLAGHTHASKRESIRCDELHLLQACGQITGLQFEPQFWFHIHGRQVKHENGRRVGYKPDFSYLERGRQVAEDIKSSATMTEAAVLRMALFRALYPEVELRVVR